MMRTVKVKKLTRDAFNKYGQFSGAFAEGEYFFDGGYFKFYRDMIQQKLVRETTVSYSLARIEKREPLLESLEYHDYCEEMILPLNSDLLMCVAPATGGTEAPLDEVECFYIPAGTFIGVKAGVWHGMPFATGEAPADVLCMLPERTYMKDCKVFAMEGEDRIKVKR